jgi:DNA-binding transcriptional ArsR family regulator
MHEGMKDFEMPTDDQVAVASDAFRLLADPTRIKLLWALLQGESSVSCLADLVGTSPTVVSQHLSKLRLAKLVRVRREGTFASTPRQTITWRDCWPRRFITPIIRSRICRTIPRASAWRRPSDGR